MKKSALLVMCVLSTLSLTIFVSFDVPASIDKNTAAIALISGFIIFSLPAIAAIMYRKKQLQYT